MEVDVIQNSKLISFAIFSFLLISSLLMSNTVLADDEIDGIVNATFTVEMISATDFKINIEMDVDRISVFGTTYDSSDIQSLASSSNDADKETMGAIKYNLYQKVDSQIEEIFEGSIISSLTSRPSYASGLFESEYSVNLTAEYLGLSESVNAYSFINGILDMGANMSYSFDLYAEPGWNNTFIFHISDEMSLNYTNTVNVNSNKNILAWTVLNWHGLGIGKKAVLTISFTNPTTTQKHAEDIFLAFVLDASDGGKTTSFNTNILARYVSIEAYDAVPDFIGNLQFLPSDGVRLFIENEFFTWDDFKQKTITPIKEIVKQTIETPLFNQTLEIATALDEDTTTNCPTPYEIGNMDKSPPIKTILNDNIDLQILDISSRALFGLVKSGAVANVSEEDINFGDNLDSLGYSYNITLFMPEGVSLEGYNKHTWDDTTVFSGEFIAEDPPSYHDEELNTVVTIEIESTDLNLLSFFTGKTELNFGLYLEELRNYNVTDANKFSLPDGISLDYLNSDAFRLCVEEKIFSQNVVDAFLRDEKNAFENRLASILLSLEIHGNINKQLFENSLKADINIMNMDNYPPVKTSSYAHSTYKVPFDLSFIPPGVNIPAQTYKFKGIQNQSVTYNMVFPQGMNIDVSDPYDKTITKEMKDGRIYFEVSFKPSEYNQTIEVTCKMNPSLLFILGIFTPCIISIIITLILIIVILIIRKKRRGRVKRRREPEPMQPPEEEITEYQEEDYYVPPPPGSK